MFIVKRLNSFQSLSKDECKKIFNEQKQFKMEQYSDIYGLLSFITKHQNIFEESLHTCMQWRKIYTEKDWYVTHSIASEENNSAFT